MAQFFAARHTVPIGPDRERLLQWRSRMAHRPAVAPVIGAMLEYLRGTALPVPEYGA
jgi:hypothetical protein